VSSFFAPFIGLEEAFGTGFTSGSIADAILVAEQNQSSVFDFGVFAVDGINVGNLAFDVFQGLFLVSDPLTGQIIHQGATQQALADSVERSRLLGLVGPPGPAGLPAAPVDLAAIIRAVTGVVGSFNREPTTGRRDLPGEPVLPGGTVNQPVVLGSTGDPRGKSRPDFPDDRQQAVELARQIGLLIRQILAARAAKRAAERREENAAVQRQLWLNFFARLGGQQMGFGQSGTQFVAPGGGALIPGIGGVIGGLLPGLIERFLPQLPGFGPDPVPSFPQLPPGIPGLSPGGGGGVCPPLFRSGAPAGFRMSPVPWFPIQAPNGKWFFFGHLGTPTFSKLKGRKRHHHHARKR